jgi:hypothetical protein
MQLNLDLFEFSNYFSQVLIGSMCWERVCDQGKVPLSSHSASATGYQCTVNPIHINYALLVERVVVMFSHHKDVIFTPLHYE